MTSSGTYTVGSEQQIDIITEMYERIGRAPSSLASNDIDSARRSLSYLFADWANEGPNLWKVQLFTQALTTGQQSITLTQQQVYVVQAYTRIATDAGDQDLMISPISRAEYAAIPYKDQTAARPTQFYLERTIIPTLYLWPTPQDDTVTIQWYSMLIQQDPGSFVNSMDAPNRWMEAIAAGGAARLAEKFAPERMDRLMMSAQKAYDRACAEDRERVPLRITIDLGGG